MTKMLQCYHCLPLPNLSLKQLNQRGPGALHSDPTSGPPLTTNIFDPAPEYFSQDNLF